MKESAIETVGLGRRYGTRSGTRGLRPASADGNGDGARRPERRGQIDAHAAVRRPVRPTTGHVSILDVVVRPNGTEHLADVGYLDQHRPMYRSLRVEEAMRLGRRLNTRWDDDAARTWIAELDISPRRG